MPPPAVQVAYRAKARWTPAGALILLLAHVLLSCSCSSPAQPNVEHAHQLLTNGSLAECQKEAWTGYWTLRDTSPAEAAKFANQEAECLIWAGSYEKALAIYSSRSLVFGGTDSRIRAIGLKVAAFTHLGHPSEALELLRQGERLCELATSISCAGLNVSAGVLSVEEGDLEGSKKYFSVGLALARKFGDSLTEATAQLDNGVVALRQRRFDEAADRIAETVRLSNALGNREIALNALGNEAWGRFRLGNFDVALKLFRNAEKLAAEFGDLAVQAASLTGVGKIQFERMQFAAASETFQKALKIEETVRDDEYIYMALVPLAQLAVESGDLEAAKRYTEEAIEIAHAGNNHVDELYPILVQGQIAARRGNIAEASHKFREVEHDDKSPVFVRWEAQRSLAHLAEDQNQVGEADREYRAAIATFEAARADVHREELQLSFLTNGARIYDDYLHFLVAHGKGGDALRWADYTRARTLAQGLGLLGKDTQTGVSALDAQQIAGRAGGTLLFYWLGNSQSYLWAITPKNTDLFILPAAEEIEAAIRRYRETLETTSGSGDVLSSLDQDGVWLYRTLVAPAQSAIPKDRRVFIFADGGLNNLNFETLVVPDPHPHFWIEDATVICASSLRVLGRQETNATARAPRNLLLIGNSVSPSDRYPSLAGAAAQVNAVSRHFPTERLRIIERENATPAAYLAANPERYSIIHFVAHGIASRASPLDSAIVLSRPGDGSDSFKLYARDIVQRPIQGKLVVISACYSAGEHAFAGEGLVGLSWGFLRAGARNVIAALGEASAASTLPLMDRFYDELDKGVQLDAALRTAKLSLLHDSRFQSPFYWAPFQLYGTGRMPPAQLRTRVRPTHASS